MAKLSDWTRVNTISNLAGDKKTAEIDIEGVIGFEPWWEEDKKTTTKEAMKKELKELANLDVDEITVNINSYGGDVNHGVSMFELLNEHKAKIHTITHGHTASAATIIAQAGDVRTMSSTGLYLVHQAQTFAAGTAEDMAATKKLLDTINSQISDIYANRNGKTPEEMREVMDRNRGLGEWLTADEALELGFIDEIKEPLAAVASAVPTIEALKIWNLPDVPTVQKEETKKENLSMLSWIKNIITDLSPEQAEIIDSIDNMESIVAENEALKAKVAEFDAISNKCEELKNEVEAAKTALTEATGAVASATDAKEEAERKLASMTAGNQPPQQIENKFDNVVEAIKAEMEKNGSDYDTASLAVYKQNPEMYANLTKSSKK